MVVVVVVVVVSVVTAIAFVKATLRTVAAVLVAAGCALVCAVDHFLVVCVSIRAVIAHQDSAAHATHRCNQLESQEALLDGFLCSQNVILIHVFMT